jgi:hypothetical protein
MMRKTRAIANAMTGNSSSDSAKKKIKKKLRKCRKLWKTRAIATP